MMTQSKTVSVADVHAAALHRTCSWDDSSSWFSVPEPVDPEKVDVFYIISADVVTAENPDGTESLVAALTDDDKQQMDVELNYVRRHIFNEDFNFFAPYHHQATFNTLVKTDLDAFQVVLDKVALEIYEAFDHYMRFENHGRRFIVAGYSQGAMLAMRLIKHMSDEQYARMTAAYFIGYRLTRADLAHPHINPARGENDTQVIVSFNSVLSREGIWDRVSRDAAVCINPLNWRTDSVPAPISYKDDTGTAAVDPDTHVVVLNLNPARFHKWMDESPFYSYAHISHDCLHHWDLLLYKQQIHDNAVRRAYGVTPCQSR